MDGTHAQARKSETHFIQTHTGSTAIYRFDLINFARKTVTIGVSVLHWVKRNRDGLLVALIPAIVAGIVLKWLFSEDAPGSTDANSSNSLTCARWFPRPKTYGQCETQSCTWPATGAEQSICDGEYGAVYKSDGYGAIVQRKGKMIFALYEVPRTTANARTTAYWNKYANPSHFFEEVHPDSGVWRYK